MNDKLFEQYFKKAYGIRPSKKSLSELQMIYLKAKDEMRKTEELYYATKTWDADYTMCEDAVDACSKS